ncbi:hypothetical protein RJ639_040301 [Escallonia herrerae]|uniref:Integrase catalytic domain-containing protein n=1 Tax=Escallonia herrerae TaxID=1293975 RepID=A0AA89B6V2_9ASTE|nr:hypothetical protein RJ639_040301 [Escallonia herrerae]
MVKGLPTIDQPDQLCEGCLIGKQHRHSLAKESISRARVSLELIHTDVYFIKQKSKVFSTFKRFKALVEKQSGYQMKALRSDRGGEFISKEFKAFCQENGIRRPLTILYSPQQNRVVERKNRLIVNMTRSMLKSKNLPKEFWAEAVDCAVYLSNRCPTRSVWNQTPQDAWSGYKPSSKGYKLYNPVDKKIKINQDMIFDEKSSWDWTDRDKEHMLCLFVNTEPIDFDEASRSEKWRKAMNEEINAIEKNDIWELTTHQSDKKPIGVKWVYKVRKNSKSEVERYKARLVVKGYKQRAGVDYDEVFTPVTGLEMI